MFTLKYYYGFVDFDKHLGNIMITFTKNTSLSNIYNTSLVNLNTTYTSNNELNELNNIIISIKNNIQKIQKNIDDNIKLISTIQLNKQLNKQTVSLNPINANNDILPLKCGVKLKSKNGYCNNKPNTKFNGKCGLHKNM
jgi:hypothetical protein